jgi:hypothetical protein
MMKSLEAAAGRGRRNEAAGVYADGQYFSKFSSEHRAGKERERKVLVNLPPTRLKVGVLM